MVKVELEEDFVSESVSLAVSEREDISFALYDQQHQPCCSTSLSKVGILLVELIVKLVETLVHEDLDHFIEISSLVQERSPFLHFLNEVFFDILHAL